MHEGLTGNTDATGNRIMPPSNSWKEIILLWKKLSYFRLYHDFSSTLLYIYIYISLYGRLKIVRYVLLHGIHMYFSDWASKIENSSLFNALLVYVRYNIFPGFFFFLFRIRRLFGIKIKHYIEVQPIILKISGNKF